MSFKLCKGIEEPKYILLMKELACSVWCHMMGTCHYTFVQTQNGQHKEWTVM